MVKRTPFCKGARTNTCEREHTLSFQGMGSSDTVSMAAGRAEELRRASSFGEEVDVHAILAVGRAQHLLKAIVSSPDSESGNRPLHLCGANGHEAIMRKLIDAGAELDAVNLAGSTALHYCAMNGQDECATALLRAGADPFTENRAGCTALDEAHKSNRGSKTADVLLTWVDNLAKSAEDPNLESTGSDEGDKIPLAAAGAE
jgi:hypothetical protein